MDSLWSAVIAVVGTIVGGIIVYMGSRPLTRANALDVTAKTLTSLSKRIDELENRDDEKERRIEALEKQVRKWRRAYNRAINHIMILAPNEPVPDFVQDTDELMKNYEKGE